MATLAVTITVDAFNPGNELQLRYAKAGEPVVTLLLQQRQRGYLVDQLGEDRNVSTGVRHRGWEFRERFEESGLGIAQ